VLARYRVTTRDECLARDRADPLAGKRSAFSLPEGIIYLDGNSLGALPRNVASRVADTIDRQWGETLIKSWNEHGWFDLPRKIGDRLSRLIGAPRTSVVACDTISVNLYKLLGAAVALRPDRRVLLSDTGNFPTDLYMMQGLIRLLDRGLELRLVDPEDIEAAITDEVAVVSLTEVDYRTGRRHDMKRLTARAHEMDALIIWDLAHSAGAFPVDLGGADADFAVGCTYKYLNGGPGAPAFLYVRPDLQDRIESPLSGWWGHEAPFAFDTDYRAAPGILRQQCGTQAILAMAALDSALDVWDDVDLHALRRKSEALCELLIAEVETRNAKHGVKLAGPRDMRQRGSHVSFHCPDGYAVMQALIAHGVIGDFRAPDIIRFGVTPLYTRFVDIWEAAAILTRILDERLWDDPRFKSRKAVT
jgi:kynureninase